MSVVALKTERFTPAQFAERTMECLPDLKGVVVVNVWNDGTYSAGWTSLATSELAMASRVMSIQTDRAIFEESD